VAKRFYITILMLLVCLTFIGESAFGQTIFAGNSRTINGYFMPYFQSWKMDSEENTENVSQFSMPLFVNLRPTENLRFWLVDSFSTTSLDKGDNGSVSLTGLSDAKAKASYSMLDRKFLITLGANFPIGNGKLNADELDVANVLYNELLGFRVNKLGSGFDINAGLAYATSFGPWGLSLSSSYLLRGSYENIEGENTKYKPGNEIGVVTALDMVTDTFILNGDIGYIHYGNDQVADEDSLKEGDEIKAKLTATYRLSPFAIILSIADTIRMKNQIPDANNALIAEDENSHGNKLDTDILLQYLIARDLSVSPTAGMTFVAENGYGEKGAFIWNVGGVIQYLPAKNIVINLNTRYLMGNMNSGDLDLSGFETGLVLIGRF